MANFPQSANKENTSTTLNGAVTSVATTITVNDASNLLAPSYLVIDRVDGSGNVQATTLWEYVYVSAISGNNLTVTRGQGGSTAQSHSNSAVIEAVVTTGGWQDARSAFSAEHALSGGHAFASTVSIVQTFVSSVASISYGAITQLLTPSIASIAAGFFGTRADVSGASVTGLPRTFVWYMPGFASAATTDVMRLVTPFGGTFRAFTATTRTPVSTASLTLAVYAKSSGASVFDTIGRPNILGGGTFVSTASIKTPNFISGDVLRADIETGGNVADITLEGIAY